jgi:hypothetical protein
LIPTNDEGFPPHRSDVFANGEPDTASRSNDERFYLHCHHTLLHAKNFKKNVPLNARNEIDDPFDGLLFPTA